jgi:hypothetical protein
VELHLLGDAQAVVQELGEPVAAPRPGLDLELELLPVRGAELDLARLEMPGERHKPERARGGARHPHRAVPGTGHPDDELVVDLERARLAAQLLEGGELRRRRAVRVFHHPAHEILGRQVRALDPDAVAAMEVRAGPVRDPLDVLAVHAVRQLGRRVQLPRSRHLAAVERRGAPEVAPGRQ